MSIKGKAVTILLVIAIIGCAYILFSTDNVTNRANRHGGIANETKKLEAATKHKPDTAGNHEQLAVFLFGKGDTDRAIKEMRTAISLEPDNPDYHCTLGTMYEKKKESKAALQSYQSCVDLMERNPEPSQQAPLYYSSLARMYDVLGKRSKAVHYYEKALHSLDWPETKTRFSDTEIQDMRVRIKSRLDSI